MLPEVEILDLAGPLQAFTEARYPVELCATKPKVHAHQGVTLSDLAPLPDDVDANTLVVVPGMPYTATERVERAITRWLVAAARTGAHIASVCTGAFILGEAGLLDGRECTTHWSRTTELAQRYPRADVREDRLFVTDGNITTSAGIVSGIDMALALIEQTDGPIVAAQVAREMVVYIRRDGGQDQTSVYLDYRTHLNPGVHRVQDWIIRNPESRASLETLADIAGMSRRSLTRTFRAATGITVHDFTTRVRIELAKTLVHDPALTLDAVAQRCGLEARQLRRLGIHRWDAPHAHVNRRDALR